MKVTTTGECLHGMQEVAGSIRQFRSKKQGMVSLNVLSILLEENYDKHITRMWESNAVVSSVAILITWRNIYDETTDFSSHIRCR